MQPASIGSATGSGTEASISSSHWDLRRKIALEHLRNSKSGYYSSGPRQYRSAPRTTQHQVYLSGENTFGKPVGIAQTQIRRRAFLPPLSMPPLLRRRRVLPQSEAAALDFPAYGYPSRAAQGAKVNAKSKRSIVSIKKVLAFATIVVVAFTFMYTLSHGVATSIPNEAVGIKEDFFFSLRSFLTASSFDLAPVNTMGRLLYSIEGVIGMMTMIIVSIVVSEKVAKL